MYYAFIKKKQNFHNIFFICNREIFFICEGKQFLIRMLITSSVFTSVRLQCNVINSISIGRKYKQEKWKTLSYDEYFKYFKYSWNIKGNFLCHFLYTSFWSLTKRFFICRSSTLKLFYLKTPKKRIHL